MEQRENQPNDSLFNRVDQIGVVVRDVDKSVEYYETFFGKDTFVVVEGEEPAVLADGREIRIKGKLAFAQLGPTQLELIEIKDGPSIHVEFLESQGEGIHHIAVYVSGFDKQIERFREKGVAVLQQGQGMRRYAYMDTKPVILELIENE
jgi:methylmalonyl-CoA/ethylmalonyl-CoA epimerase